MKRAGSIITEDGAIEWTITGSTILFSGNNSASDWAICPLDRIWIDELFGNLSDEKPEVTKPEIQKMVLAEGCQSVDWGMFTCDYVAAFFPNLKELVLPSSIRYLSDYSFSEFENLEKVTFTGTFFGEPKPVLWESYAFANCCKLVWFDIQNCDPVYAAIDGVLVDKDRRILLRFPPGRGVSDGADKWFGDYVIPEGIVRIGNGVFLRCQGLTSVKISNGVKEIGDNAFSECDNLISVLIPDGVERIESHAFSFCENLTELVIPDSVTEIGASAFKSVPHIIYHGPAQSEDNWGAKSRN